MSTTNWLKIAATPKMQPEAGENGDIVAKRRREDGQSDGFWLVL